MFKYSEKGVSLIITFFIMIIILSVVLSISILLYSEVKIIKNMSDSMVSFFAADSGAEKVLYYDRQVIPEGAVRGICNICEALDDCPDTTSMTGCKTCLATPNPNSIDGCTDCTDCSIVFETTMATSPHKYYNAAVNISTFQREGQCPLSLGQLKSVGTYSNTSRAVNLDIAGDVKTGLGPGVSDNGTDFIVNQNQTVIHIHVLAPEDLDSVEAYIYYSPTDPADGGTYALYDDPSNPVSLSYNSGLREWQGNWGVHVEEGGLWYVGIGVIDADGYCTSIVITS